MRVGVGKGVDMDGEGSFGSDYMGYFIFEFLRSLVNEGGVVDEIVFGGVVFGFECVEEGFFGIKDLDGIGGVFGKVY